MFDVLSSIFKNTVYSVTINYSSFIYFFFRLFEYDVYIRAIQYNDATTSLRHYLYAISINYFVFKTEHVDTETVEEENRFSYDVRLENHENHSDKRIPSFTGILSRRLKMISVSFDLTYVIVFFKIK